MKMPLCDSELAELSKADPRIQLLTLRSVARLLRVCPRTVSRMIERGELLGCRVGKRSTRVPLAEIFDYVRRMTLYEENEEKNECSDFFRTDGDKS